MADAAGLLAWLHASPLGQEMRGNLWMYPIVEIVHIAGFVMLVGPVTMFDLRVLGCARSISVKALGRHLLPWAVASLALVVPAGLMMFSAHPHDFIANPVFLLKLSLIAAAGVNAALFHAGVYRGVAAWDARLAAPPLARLHAAASIALWLAIISCGRLLAYT